MHDKKLNGVMQSFFKQEMTLNNLYYKGLRKVDDLNQQSLKTADNAALKKIRTAYAVQMNYCNGLKKQLDKLREEYARQVSELNCEVQNESSD